MAAAASHVSTSDAVKPLSISETVPGPGYVDLARKYSIKAYAVLSRELVLHQLATARSLTDRVYWALILTSCCGPDVREGCFDRNEDAGRLVRDEKNQLYPLRVKHLLALLKLKDERRRDIHLCIKNLKKRGSLEERDPLKIWYPVFDPAKLSVESVRENTGTSAGTEPNTSPFI